MQEYNFLGMRLLVSIIEEMSEKQLIPTRTTLLFYGGPNYIKVFLLGTSMIIEYVFAYML
jgi:hypothetical protein